MQIHAVYSISDCCVVLDFEASGTKPLTILQVCMKGGSFWFLPLSLTAVGLCTGHLAALRLNFLDCKMGTMSSTLNQYDEH